MRKVGRPRTGARIGNARLSAGLLWTLALLAVCLGWIALGVHTAEDAAFESSDGKWSEREDSIKGYDFRAIRTSFEEFKQTCNLPDAAMFRTAERHPLHFWAWWNYILDAKWRVPFQTPKASQTPNSSCQ